jgi:hypothetical protein
MPFYHLNDNEPSWIAIRDSHLLNYTLHQIMEILASQSSTAALKTPVYSDFDRSSITQSYHFKLYPSSQLRANTFVEKTGKSEKTEDSEGKIGIPIDFPSGLSALLRVSAPACRWQPM